MQSLLQKRVHRLGTLDLIVSVVGLICHVAAIGLVAYLVELKEYPPILQHYWAQVMLWTIMVLVAVYRVVLVYSAYRLLKVSDKTDTTPTLVMGPFRSWNILNCIMIVVSILAVSNIFAVVYNLYIVCVSRSVQKELGIRVMETSNNTNYANNAAVQTKIV